MKFILILILPFLLMIGTNCSTSSDAMQSQEKDSNHNTIKEPDQFVELADHLRKVPGVVVSGSGRNATVNIRGISSMNMSTEPLFVVNGQIVSGGLKEATDLVPVENISSIKVLKSPSELSMYGVRGANGVIEIRLKN